VAGDPAQTGRPEPRSPDLGDPDLGRPDLGGSASLGSALSGPELVVHLYAPTDGPRAAQAYAFLREVWAACRRTLNMEPAFDRLGVPAVLPGSIDDLRGQGVLAAQLHLGDGVHQVLLRRDDDLLCLSVLLAPPDDGAFGWSRPEEQWRQVAGALPPSLVGAVRLYQGHLGQQAHLHQEGQVGHLVVPVGVPGPVGVRVPATPALARACGAARSGWDQAPGWEDRGVTTGAGFAVWEPVAVADDQLERTLLILVPACRDGELVAWTWRRRDAAAPPLQRYLAAAAKVRYQWRVRDGGDAIRRQWDRIDERTARLRQLIRDPGPRPAAQAAQAAQAADLRQLVRRLRVDRAELVTLAARLTQMRRNVEISGANMAALLRADGTSPGDHDPFAVDRRLVEHLVDQLDDDLVFLGAVSAGTEAALELAGPVPTDMVDHGQIEDIQLTPEERVELCAELAAVFGTGLRAAHLMEEIGLPRARQLAAAGVVPLAWWTEMLRELGHGAVESPYRRTLEAALRAFAHNRVFVRLARRHRLAGQ
jgi:hypothetical protein